VNLEIVWAVVENELPKHAEAIRASLETSPAAEILAAPQVARDQPGRPQLATRPSGLRARAKTNSQLGRDSVVPLREDLTGLEAKYLKLFGRGLYAGRIVAAIQMRGDRQTGLGSGGADEAEDLLVAVEGLPRRPPPARRTRPGATS
jgi:hypothetical protein